MESELSFITLGLKCSTGLFLTWSLLTQTNKVHWNASGLALLFWATRTSNTRLQFLNYSLVLAACGYGYIRSVLDNRKIKCRRKHVVVITGCDSGLGYSFALRVHQLGMSVVAGCLNLNSEGAKTISALDYCEVRELDVTKPESVKDLYNFLERISSDSELYAVINNAGVMIFGEFEWLTQDHILHQVKVNLLGMFSVTKHLLPLLRRHKGRLINITSHCAEANLPGLAVYGATKAAIQSWSDGLRVEQAKYGVKVITFTPGSFVMQSSILSRQSTYAKEMESSMSESDKLFYGSYFELYHSYLAGLPVSKTVNTIQDEKLYAKFDSALLNMNPEPFYRHGPFRYTVYHFMFKWTPTWLRDKLVVRFINMPRYRLSDCS